MADVSARPTPAAACAEPVQTITFESPVHEPHEAATFRLGSSRSHHHADDVLEAIAEEAADVPTLHAVTSSLQENHGDAEKKTGGASGHDSSGVVVNADSDEPVVTKLIPDSASGTHSSLPMMFCQPHDYCDEELVGEVAAAEKEAAEVEVRLDSPRKDDVLDAKQGHSRPLAQPHAVAAAAASVSVRGPPVQQSDVLQNLLDAYSREEGDKWGKGGWQASAPRVPTNRRLSFVDLRSAVHREVIHEMEEAANKEDATTKKKPPATRRFLNPRGLTPKLTKQEDLLPARTRSLHSPPPPRSATRPAPKKPPVRRLFGTVIEQRTSVLETREKEDNRRSARERGRSSVGRKRSPTAPLPSPQATGRRLTLKDEAGKTAATVASTSVTLRWPVKNSPEGFRWPNRIEPISLDDLTSPRSEDVATQKLPPTREKKPSFFGPLRTVVLDTPAVKDAVPKEASQTPPKAPIPNSNEAPANTEKAEGEGEGGMAEGVVSTPVPPIHYPYVCPPFPGVPRHSFAAPRNVSTPHLHKAVPVAVPPAAAHAIVPPRRSETGTRVVRMPSHGPPMRRPLSQGTSMRRAPSLPRSGSLGGFFQMPVSRPPSRHHHLPLPLPRPHSPRVKSKPQAGVRTWVVMGQPRVLGVRRLPAVWANGGWQAAPTEASLVQKQGKGGQE
ncbi:unnamed protein product [Vitrella brassicaformis CCMP3155]|uniref:Uncharacterized protein n=1 Tax=Vitrella brassicaformis (strain CCMP3155) TaxID=1169540 RepID=A0A0G4FT32_VITBC|nr:unnamed protein product [Vitrella brassicaformis CCMP3155]|eukprot:CEM17642.1 unnamed protein product [Vitrella brassicaformis CCMP3155]